MAFSDFQSIGFITLCDVDRFTICHHQIVQPKNCRKAYKLNKFRIKLEKAFNFFLVMLFELAFYTIFPYRKQIASHSVINKLRSNIRCDLLDCIAVGAKY